MNDAPLPIEFAELAPKISYVQRNNANHYRSSCPVCGEAGHSARNGHPDRFQMWLVSQKTGGPFGWCSRCDYKWWPGRETGEGVDPETMRLLEQQAAVRREAEENLRRKKLSEFSDHEIWKEYCERMQSKHHDWWLKQGIPLDVQQYLSLGYTPQRKYKVGDAMHTSPAYTIPWFGDNFDFQTMQYRLTQPVNPSDKYRFEHGLSGGGKLFFRADPAEKIGNKVIVCEGAKKAMVTRFRLLPVDTDITVIASAAKGTINPVMAAVKDAEIVYVIFDPDGQLQARKIAKNIGSKAHIVSLPYKVDDGFLRYGMTRQDFGRILDTVL